MRTLLRGQVSITVASIGALGMIVASVVASWATASTNIARVQAQVEVVTERENNHYGEVQRQLSQIDGKIDQLIQKK